MILLQRPPSHLGRPVSTLERSSAAWLQKPHSPNVYLPDLHNKSRAITPAPLQIHLTCVPPPVLRPGSWTSYKMNNHQSIKDFGFESWNHGEEHLAILASSTMQRYLLEQDRSWFTSSTVDSEDPTTQAFPGDLCGASNCTYDGVQHNFHIPYRLSSPASSGLESSALSSSLDDRQCTPWSSPDISSVPRVWRHSETPSAFLGDRPYPDQDGSLFGHSCVAMNDVQYHTEVTAFEDDAAAAYTPYGSQAQEGYQPMMQPLDEQHISEEWNTQSAIYTPQKQESQQASTRSDSDVPISRRRHPRARRSVTSPGRTSKIAKRIQPTRQSSHQAFAERESSSEVESTSPPRIGAFSCPLQPYGCPATFGSKNEWKRHVTSQHMRWGFWRCEWCPEHKPNDFNRKDLFIQHVRRMHPQELLPRNRDNKKSAKDTKEEQASNAASDRCYRDVRTPPNDSHCLLCDLPFHGPGSWEERMEHMGRHMEAAKKGAEASITPQDWRVDSSTHEWMAREGIIELSGRRWVLAEKS